MVHDNNQKELQIAGGSSSFSFVRILTFLLLALLLFFPFLAQSYVVHLVNLAWLACLGALALNVLTGYAGLISLGTGGFLCLGAFSTVVSLNEFGSTFGVSVAISALLGGLLGFFTGLPALRLKGVYLLLSTLAMHFVIVYLCGFYQIKKGYIGGVTLPDPIILPGIVLNSSLKWYFFLVIILIIVTVFLINLSRTFIGRAWVASRDKDIAAQILGVNVSYYRLLAFIFSSALIAVTGSLQAYYIHFAAYEQYTIWVSVMYLAMIIVGGLGSIVGSYIGAYVITLLPYFLPLVRELISLPMRVNLYFSSIELAAFGFIIIVFVLVEPLGLVGMWEFRIRPGFQKWINKIHDSA